MGARPKAGAARFLGQRVDEGVLGEPVVPDQHQPVAGNGLPNTEPRQRRTFGQRFTACAPGHGTQHCCYRGGGAAGPAHCGGQVPPHRLRCRRDQYVVLVDVRERGDIDRPLHRLGQGDDAGQGADHDDELGDRAVLVAANEVAALYPPIPYPCREDERVVATARSTDLAYIAEVLEDARDRADHPCDRLAPTVRAEYDGAPKLHVVGEQPDGCVDVARLDRDPESMHDVRL
jgi:hypothetical protein